MSEIVSEADFLGSDEGVRIVRLASSYGYELYELYANISPNAVTLRKLASDSKPKDARFIAAEMDAICKAWQQFKVDRSRALADEEIRKAEVVQQAYDLAATVEGVKVEEGEETSRYDEYVGPRWIVSVPAMGHSTKYRHPDGLLEGVREAISEWHDHLLRARTQAREYQAMIENGHEGKWIVENLQRNLELLQVYGHVLGQIEPGEVVEEELPPYEDPF